MGEPIIADNLSNAGWSWGCVATVDRQGRTIYAHRDTGKRFVVRADETLTGFFRANNHVSGRVLLHRRTAKRLIPAKYPGSGSGQVPHG
jgi:hypothetical protein